MAFTFNGTSDRLDDATASAVTTADGLTMACWVNFPTNTGERTAVAVSNTGDASPFARFGVSNNAVWVQHRDVSTFSTFSGGTVTNDSWEHIAGTFFESGIQMFVEGFINGVSQGDANPNDTATTNLDQTTIGVTDLAGSPLGFWNGGIAEVGIWNVQLTAPELLQLAAGYPPPMVRPQSLVMYNPLKAFSQDVIGTNTFTVTGTSLLAHPPMQQVLGQVISFSAGGGPTLPVLSNPTTPVYTP